MNEYIAYCGLDCEACKARIATVNNDAELAKTPYCESLCPIRQCAMSRGLETCGGCGEMERCKKLGAITEHNADALKRLKTGI